MLASFGVYNLLLFIHIGAAITWVGGAILLNIQAFRIMSTGDPLRIAHLAGDAEFFGTRVFMPAALVVVVAGVSLVLNGGWGFGHLWVILALLAFAYSFITGAFYLGPQSGRIKKGIERQGGSAEGDVADMIKKVLTVSRIELGILIVIVFLMVFKPGS
jgi:uncharacterized membrane protein